LPPGEPKLRLMFDQSVSWAMNELSSRLGQVSTRRGVSAPARYLALDFSYRRVRATLWTISLATIALGLFHQVYIRWAGPSVFGFRDLLNFDSERSIPTWWSYLLLIAVALVVLLNGVAEPNRKWKPHWFWLFAIFIFLSIDEFSGIHERFIGVLAPYNFTGVLHFSWVIPYGALCLLVGTLYSRFVLELPADIRWRTAIAGGIYIVAAIGMEMVGGYCRTNPTCYSLEVVAEESGEIAGATLFFLAMILLLQRRCLGVALFFQHAGRQQPASLVGGDGSSPAVVGDGARRRD
jgi:hypothetical protein